METIKAPTIADTSKKAYKLSKRLGRGIPTITSAYGNICSCNRAKAIVFCRGCGYHCQGRIKLKCQQHPHVTFLFDIAQCPKCYTSVYLDEHRQG
ncbi:unnamed protein product [Leptidea sinapis]|uniref:Uncharacterized protein n=1 Tax=Leptidea sinapis TaxID=189913 RepID=A0A5E4QFC1_9NEOP|nr:unnamed protein product [Leptidea sinapis]